MIDVYSYFIWLANHIFCDTIREKIIEVKVWTEFFYFKG